MACSLAEFVARTSAWVAQEQLNELLQLGNTALVTAALGLVDLGFEDVLAAKQSSFSLLDQSKRRILNETQTSSGIDYIIGLSLETQGSLIADIDSIVADLQEKTDGLSQSTQKTPTFNSTKSNLTDTIDGLKKLHSSVQKAAAEPESAADALQELVIQGLITQESLDDYLSTTPLIGRVDNLDRRQVVRELRDRYYVVERNESSNPVLAEPLSVTPQFKLVDVDTGEEIKGVSGYEAGELNSDGTINLAGLPEGTAQNASKNLRIEPDRTSQRPTNASPSVRLDMRDLASSVQTDLDFEVWACLILEIVAYLRSSWDRVLAAIDRFLDILLGMKSIERGSPFGPAIDSMKNESFGALSAIKGALGDVIPHGTPGSELLSIQGDMGLPQLGGNPGATICDFNHLQYCLVHDNLLRFLDSIFADLDLLNFSFGGLNLSDLNFALDALLALLVPFISDLRDEADKVSDLIDKLQGDICAFASRRMKGTPKSLSAIEDALLAIRALIAAAPSFLPSVYGIAQSAIIAAEILRLTQAGYGAAVLALSSGDLMAFLMMDERDATFSGQVARCLADAANRCGDNVKARRMRELANATRSRSDQQITGQRIREGARQRRSLNNGAAAAANITAEAIALVTACALEDS